MSTLPCCGRHIGCHFVTSPILRQHNKVKPSTSEASKHALFTLEATIERIVFSREKKSCNKRLKHVHRRVTRHILPARHIGPWA